jgi:hypothetical protein
MPMTCQYFFIRSPGEFNRAGPNCEWKSGRVFKTVCSRSELEFKLQLVPWMQVKARTPAVWAVSQKMMRLFNNYLLEY